MKKVTLIFISAILFSITLNSQVKVNSSGNLGVGITNPISPITVGSNGYINTTLNAFGTAGQYHRAIRASQPVSTPSGDYSYGLSGSVTSGTGGAKLFGVYGTTYRGTSTSEAMTFGVYGFAGNGKNGNNYGVYGTITGSRYGAGIVGTTDQQEPGIPGKYAGYFLGVVKITQGLWVGSTYYSSDINLKKDIKPIEENVLDKLGQLQSIRYKLKHPTEYKENSDTTNLDLLSKELQSEMYTKDRIGLIAQEIQSLFPEVVKKDAEGFLGINYQELIPVLIKAINQQQHQINQLESTINDQDQKLKASGIVSSSIIEDDEIWSENKLDQNRPNPFTENTSIRFTIPTIKSYAMVNVYDLQGSQVKSYSISETGNSEILIPGSELNPGIFLYNLIVDGEEIDTKRMILTER